jgi:hypothetical protein
MARFRINTALTRMQLVTGADPAHPRYERVDYPAGSVVEPTNAEFSAFQDVLERVEDSTPLTEVGAAAPQADPNAPYDPDAVAAAPVAPTPPAVEESASAESATSRRR